MAGLEVHGGAGLLRSVCVRSAARGQGLGPRLCDAIEDRAAAAGLGELYLLTTTARAFFERRGYHVVDRASAPERILQTAEFQSLCPSSATCLSQATGEGTDMSCATAVDRIRALIAGGLPPELQTATVSVGHPGSTEEYTLALNLYVLQVREDVLARERPGLPRPTVIEAPVLVAAHAPPERGFDAVRLLELAVGVIRANPHLGPLSPHATAEVGAARDDARRDVLALAGAAARPCSRASCASSAS